MNKKKVLPALEQRIFKIAENYASLIEKRLLEAINQHYSDKTLLISAHRMSSVVDCDEILYLLDGRIAERGTFEELMEQNGHFASVYNIQEAQKKSVIDFDQLAEGGAR